jgi:hypothetical protein
MRQARSEIVAQIETTLQMDRQDADAFYDEMIERKAYLFPDEIQPEGPMTMFMRKEVEYLITPLCVQRRRTRSAGVSPAKVKARSLVAWMAGRRETEFLKPIDNVIFGMAASHRAVAQANTKWSRK